MPALAELEPEIMDRHNALIRQLDYWEAKIVKIEDGPARPDHKELAECYRQKTTILVLLCAMHGVNLNSIVAKPAHPMIDRHNRIVASALKDKVPSEFDSRPPTLDAVLRSNLNSQLQH